MRENIKTLLKKALLEAKKVNTWPDFDMPEIAVEQAKNEQFGDYTSNIAMALAKKAKKTPMEIAQELKVQSEKLKVAELEKIEVAAPGYINFYLSKKYLQNVVEEINSEKENFGNLEIGKVIKVNNEFISANPTGPLHLGNGRGGFYGDSLSKVLRKAGFDVTNEYFINDAGEQIIKLGHSVLKDSEAVYSGEYIDKLNEKYGNIADVKEAGQPALLREALLAGEKAAEDILKNIIQKTAKEKMQISFDEWVSEKEIQNSSYTSQAIELFQEKKLTYEAEGALWLKTTELGDDKDRVLVKKDGQKTYFASDCGYILNKKERGFNRIIEIWGADHHGYVDRFRAAAEILGFKKEQIKFIIVQLVRLIKDGKEARMSKRAGNVVYIDDLIDEIGIDAARFFFLMYSPDTHMNFDLDLAKERSQKNPVYYVQYAHARISSILEKAKDTRDKKQETNIANLTLLSHEKELSLIRELNKFPELIEEIAESYEVHKLPQYAIRLADKFHSFYDTCRVIDEGNKDLTESRLLLVNAVRIVLLETLNLIGVSAPAKM
jgi:arginyl-tRNA synthetase